MIYNLYHFPKRMIEVNNVFRHNRMLQMILSDIILVFSQSSFQLPFCLADIRSIAVFARNFINHVIIRQVILYLYVFLQTYSIC